MATVKIKIDGFVQLAPHDDNPRFVASDMTQYGYINVGPVETEIDFEIPEGFNRVTGEIDMLEKKLTSISDEFMKQSRAIKSRIADLKCLPAPTEAGAA
jgi:hypothetical protein